MQIALLVLLVAMMRIDWAKLLARRVSPRDEKRSTSASPSIEPLDKQP